MIPYWLLSESTRRHLREQHQAEVERRLPLAVPWDPMMKWDPELNLQASSYEMKLLAGLSAAMTGVPVNFAALVGDSDDEDEKKPEPLGLLKIFKETKVRLEK